MAIPNQILDGTPPHGTLGTATINAVAYIVEDEKCTPHWNSGEDRLANGLPNRKRWTKDRYDLELTLQLATPTTPYPPAGATYSYTPKGEATALVFVVLDTPEERNNETSFIETAKIKLQSTVNAITTS